MNNLVHRLSWLALLCSLILASCGGGETTASSFSSSTSSFKSRIRVVHLSANAPAVNFFRNDDLLSEDTQFGEATPYQLVSAEDAVFELSSSQSFTEFARFSFSTESDADYSLFFSGELNSIRAEFTLDDNSTPRVGQARLRVFHAVPDGAVVDIYVFAGDDFAPETSIPSFSEAVYGSATKYLQNKGGRYLAVLTPTGSTTIIATSDEFQINTGKIYTLALVPGDPQTEQFGFLLLEDNL